MAAQSKVPADETYPVARTTKEGLDLLWAMANSTTRAKPTPALKALMSGQPVTTKKR